MLTSSRLCGVRLLAMGKITAARSVNSFNRPGDTSFAIRRFVEESVDAESEPQALPQTVIDFAEPEGDVDDRKTLTTSRKRMLDSNPSLD